MVEKFEENVFEFKGGRLGYYIAGKGSKLILAFPGFGHCAKDFEVMIENLPEDHSLLAMDYFGEGKSCLYNSEEIIEIDDFNSLIRTIPKVRVAKSIVLLGYSLGGRIVMSMYNDSSENIERIIMLAPDGLKRNRIHYFLSGTSAGRSLFKFCSVHPGFVNKIVKAVIASGLVNDKLGKFILSNTIDSTVLNKVRLTWQNFGRFWPDISTFGHLLIKNQTTLTLVMGKHDKIILPKFAEKLKSWDGIKMRLEIAQGGHDLIKSGFPFAEWLK